LIQLDIITIQVLSFTINVMLAGFIWLQRRPPIRSVALAARFWSTGFAAIGFGALLTLIGHSRQTPEFLTLGEALSVGGFVLPILGIRAFVNLSVNLIWFLVAFLLAAGISGYFSILDPNPVLRIAGLSLVGFVLCTWTAVSVRFWLPNSKVGLRSRRPVAAIASLIGLFFLYYALRAISGNPMTNLPYSSTFDTSAPVACAALVSIFLALWCLFIMGGRLGRSLRKEVERRDRLLSVLAHDLRSPFNILLGDTEALELMARRGKTDRVLGMASDIHTASQQAYALTDSLLVWVRSQLAGEEPEPINLDRAVRAAHAPLVGLLKRKRVSCQPPPESGLNVLACAGSVETVIRNLLSNSVKFSRPGSTVNIRLRRDGQTVQIDVQDTGVGMSSREVEAALDPDNHHSTFGTEGETGTGLGLSFCQDIVKSHGGKLTISSQLGLGTTVMVILPLAEDDG